MFISFYISHDHFGGILSRQSQVLNFESGAAAMEGWPLGDEKTGMFWATPTFLSIPG
jgi:hypothetical protein